MATKRPFVSNNGQLQAIQTGDSLDINGITVGPGSGGYTTNTVIGVQSFLVNTTGAENVACGEHTLAFNTTGSFNVACGGYTLNQNTSGQYNVAIGLNAALSNTSASWNVAVGAQSLSINSTGTYNTAIGGNALHNTSGSFNVAVGDSALNDNTTGVNNVAVGYRALYGGITASNNTVVGYNALNTTAGTGPGSNNCMFGSGAGSSLNASESGNVIIGASNGTSIAGTNNNIVISDGVGTERILINNAGSANFVGADVKFNGNTITFYDVAGGSTGAPTASAKLLTFVVVRPFSFPLNFTGSYAVSGVAATASTVLTVNKNGIGFGTITYAPAATTGTFSSTATSFVAGDIITVVAPASPDATLADIGFTLVGAL